MASNLELQTMRKVAWRLVPLVSLAYLINVLDRFNISFAALTSGCSALEPLALTVEFAGTTASALDVAGGAAGVGGSLLSQPTGAKSATSPTSATTAPMTRVLLLPTTSKRYAFISQTSR